MKLWGLRSMNQTATDEHQSVNETQEDPNSASKQASTIEGEDTAPGRISSGSRISETDECGDESASMQGASGKRNSQIDGYIDVTEDDGMIIIPHKEVPDNWTEAPDMLSYQSLDRSFVFPGEQIRILACLSPYKQDSEIITPFKVAALMNKNGIGQSPPSPNGNIGDHVHIFSHLVDSNDSEQDFAVGESLLRLEERRKQSRQLLEKLKNSHFFARISESNEPLWSKRRTIEAIHSFPGTLQEQLISNSSGTAKSLKKKKPISAVIDRGQFEAFPSGGISRGDIQCCCLSNGEIVVLLQVNVGVEFIRDPVIEILQCEKYQETNLALEDEHIPTSLNNDPFGDLLKWLLPLNNSPSSRPPTLSSSSSIRSMPQKPTVSGSSGSQLFSFGHFRSYSMSSLPPNSAPPETITTPAAKPNFDPEDWDLFTFKKLTERGKRGNEGLLSFRGAPLVPQRFFVRCGLEGIFTPGRRWRRKIQVVQPIEIHSFTVECNTDDLLCVHVKNVSPVNAPEILVFIDSITIVIDEASRGGPPQPIPTSCIKAGNQYSLPNLALRRGEEHSFILKTAMIFWKCSDRPKDSNPQFSHTSTASNVSSQHPPSNIEGRHGGPTDDKYAVLVSCHCNYTESKLFFMKPISWRPRIRRELMISIASEIPKQTLGSNGMWLPFQVLTVQASNMTSDDLTLTVLAQTSPSSPSVMSLNNSPSAPLSRRGSSTDLVARNNNFRYQPDMDRLSSASWDQGEDKEDGPHRVSENDKPMRKSDVVCRTDLGCMHLWLQSQVSLGCVRSQSTATIKLEVLPLKGGLITLDSLQIDVKEKGLKFVPEKELKIYATSSINGI